MVRMGIVIAVVFLFFGLCAFPCSSIINKKSDNILSFGNILYVGGSGPNNYTRIQDAVDNASNGDTVFVYSGIYSHYFPGSLSCVLITKSISLIGEDKYTTIINGSGTQRVVYIQSDKVQVSGFTIQNGGNPGESSWGIGVDFLNHRTNAIITDNIIIYNQRGIFVEQFSSNVEIYDNIINNNRYGIYSDYDTNITNIHNNIISYNSYGIYSWHSQLSIHHNQIINNSIGMFLTDVNNDYLISHNNIKENNVGLELSQSRQTTIKQNNFINNNKHYTLSKGSILMTIPYLLVIRQRWRENYWDDWENQSPRPIVGKSILFVTIVIPLKPFIIPVPIFLLPSFEFDWNPSQEPYNI